MITIIDYGMGNLGSIENMFRYLGFKVTVEKDLDIFSIEPRLPIP